MAQNPNQPGDADTPSPSEFRTLQEIRDVLAERKQIAVFWSAEDVQAVRPDLSLDQSWEVLQRAEDRHDPAIGVNFNSLGVLAEEMFPQYHEEEMSAEDWQRLKSEWTQDYGLRYMEDRGVKYEDEVERFFDHLAGQAASPEPAGAALQAEGQQERQVSPADLQERTGLAESPADLLAKLQSAVEAAKADVRENPAVDVSREELGRLPTQDPPRLRPNL